MAKTNKQPRRAKLDQLKKEEMLAILIRNQDAYSAVQASLRPEHVAKISPGHALIWTLVRDFFEKNDQLPPKDTLLADMAHALHENTSLLTEEECTQVDEFIEYAYGEYASGQDISGSELHKKIALTTCRLFLEETLASDFRDRILSQGMLPVDVPAVLEEAREQLEAVSSLEGTNLDVPFPEGWDKRKSRKLMTCGVSVLDDFMGGGWRAPEAIVFLGTMGSCKTTTTITGVSAMIKHAASLLASKKVRKRKGKLLRPVVVLVFTEGDKDEYRDRLLSNLASVPWKRLAQMSSVDSLSDALTPGTDGPTAYESKLFADEHANGLFENEQTRVRKAAALANRHLVLLDCTDAEDAADPLVGRNGIPQIGVVLKSHFRKRHGTYPIAVYIDHMSALADRMAGTGVEADEKRDLLLKRMPLQAITTIAKPFRCPVALFHQLSGSSNLKRPTAVFHHAEGSGSKLVAEYAAFAFVTGPADSNGHCVWACTKHRREPATPTKIVEVQGMFNQVIDVTFSHQIVGHTIMHKDELKKKVNMNDTSIMTDNNGISYDDD